MYVSALVCLVVGQECSFLAIGCIQTVAVTANGLYIVHVSVYVYVCLYHSCPLSLAAVYRLVFNMLSQLFGMSMRASIYVCVCVCMHVRVIVHLSSS